MRAAHSRVDRRRQRAQAALLRLLAGALLLGVLALALLGEEARAAEPLLLAVSAGGARIAAGIPG